MMHLHPSPAFSKEDAGKFFNVENIIAVQAQQHQLYLNNHQYN
jgi:hypothetical protein